MFKIFKKKLSEKERILKEVQERNIRILEHQADQEIKKAIQLRPDLSKLAIIQRLLIQAEKEKALHYMAGNFGRLEGAQVHAEYYKKCINYQMYKFKQENKKKAKKLKEHITGRSGIINETDFFKETADPMKIKKQLINKITINRDQLEQREALIIDGWKLFKGGNENPKLITFFKVKSLE